MSSQKKKKNIKSLSSHVHGGRDGPRILAIFIKLTFFFAPVSDDLDRLTGDRDGLTGDLDPSIGDLDGLTGDLARPIGDLDGLMGDFILFPLVSNDFLAPTGDLSLFLSNLRGGGALDGLGGRPWTSTFLNSEVMLLTDDLEVWLPPDCFNRLCVLLIIFMDGTGGGASGFDTRVGAGEAGLTGFTEGGGSEGRGR